MCPAFSVLRVEILFNFLKMKTDFFYTALQIIFLKFSNIETEFNFFRSKEILLEISFKRVFRSQIFLVDFLSKQFDRTED